MTTVIYILGVLWFTLLAIEMGYVAYMTIRDDRRKEKARKESIEKDIF